jgi:MFS transporter, CP family, cyanate transporter
LIVSCIAPLVIPRKKEPGINHAGMGTIMGAWQLIYIFAAMPGGLMLDRLGGLSAIAMLLIVATFFLDRRMRLR